MKKLQCTISALMLIGVFVACLAPSASANESTLDFRVVPTPGSSVSEGGDYFVLAMDPGDALTQSLHVSNPSKQSLRVHLGAVDAATAQMGGVDYGAQQLATDATGSWITLDHKRIELGPGESRQVSFDVAVPSDATAGVHLGGLVVWVEGAEEKMGAGAGATMNVQSRRVVAVQVDLPGPAVPVLEIAGAKAEARPDGLYLGIELFNSGTGFAKGRGSVLIEGRDAEESFLVDTVVPGTGTTYPFKWAASGVANGSYDVSIEVDYGSAIATWEGQVMVGAVVQDDLRGRGVKTSGGAHPRLYLGIGAALVLAIVAALLRKRLFLGRRLTQLRAPRRRTRVAPVGPVVAHLSPSGATPRPVVTPAPFVPRSEEEQRRVPPPPPPPPPGRPATSF